MGPYRPDSWISSIAVPETNDPAHNYTWYVAGCFVEVWKTENNGINFYPVFDSLRVSSIGAVAALKSNPDVVWVGTG